MRFSVTSYFPSLHGKQAYYNPTPQIVKENIWSFYVKTAENLYFHTQKAWTDKKLVQTSRYTKKARSNDRALFSIDRLEIDTEFNAKAKSVIPFPFVCMIATLMIQRTIDVCANEFCCIDVIVCTQFTSPRTIVLCP